MHIELLYSQMIRKKRVNAVASCFASIGHSRPYLCIINIFLINDGAYCAPGKFPVEATILALAACWRPILGSWKFYIGEREKTKSSSIRNTNHFYFWVLADRSELLISYGLSTGSYLKQCNLQLRPPGNPSEDVIKKCTFFPITYFKFHYLFRTDENILICM